MSSQSNGPPLTPETLDAILTPAKVKTISTDAKAGLYGPIENLQALIALAKSHEALRDQIVLALQGRTWQPMESAPKKVKAFWWIVPKSPDETFIDTSGNPIVSNHKPYLHCGVYGSWGALSKPTHWMPLPPAPPQAQEK